VWVARWLSVRGLNLEEVDGLSMGTNDFFIFLREGEVMPGGAAAPHPHGWTNMRHTPYLPETSNPDQPLEGTTT